MSPLYKVIIADPPWGYANWSERKNGAAQAIYNTMSIEDLCAMPGRWITAATTMQLLGVNSRQRMGQVLRAHGYDMAGGRYTIGKDYLYNLDAVEVVRGKRNKQ